MPYMRAMPTAVLTLAFLFFMSSCGFRLAPLPAGSIAGRANVYDYSPSVIQSGNLQQAWWCGLDSNEKNRAQFSDSIQYQSIDLTTHKRYGPVPVLGETPGAWDSVFTCNPKVVKGSFLNPLGNGESFTYAMYYVGLGSVADTNNYIGVAFSNDGISWKKYPQPVISPESSNGYGVGQPAIYNDDQQSAIRIFYEDDDRYIHHVEAVSSDGVHFTKVGILTSNGLDPSSPTWGDMAYDAQTGYWYAAFNTTPRKPTTTGEVLERGSYGIELYRIPDNSLLTGAAPWQLLANIDTNLTGFEANFLPAFVRDPYGNLVVGSAVQMYTSISNPPPPWNAPPATAGASGDIAHWDIASASWTPSHPLMPLQRYFNQTAHEVTTGWIDPKGGFSLEYTLGNLYQSPRSGADLPFYGCKGGSMDYFISLDSGCEGSLILGVNGYGYSKPISGLNLVALYRCSTGHDHFASQDPGCEGQQTQQLLGYVVPE